MAAIAVSVLAAIAFLIIYLPDVAALSRKHPGVRAASRHLIVTTVVSAVELLGLLLLAAGVPLPLFVFAVVYWCGAAVMIHRIVLVLRARRSPARQ